MAVVPIRSLYETHLTVSDLDRSIAFYRDVLGLELAHRVPDRHAAFFWVGARERSMLGLWSIHSSPLRFRLHISFKVDLEDVKRSIPALRDAGVEPRPAFGLPAAEPIVFSWMPAASVFFDDPDGHSLEFIASLPEPPRPELGVMSLSRWRMLQQAGNAGPPG
ncbi:VOC family protein [Inquilinus sp. Marseille-Q2685]|uniref:VOC family protein n=1 Tax=Inquilinus sp. Marseille-Q2685 TaxID=2866581 RepID=UPI001CE43FB3|nr:VOC family protein [Inquilinus sp. Marseille-Q2685]